MKNILPNVLDCNAKECSYNRENECHAGAINVGNDKPLCDTFYNIPVSGGYNNIKPKVGACKVVKCKHNNELECDSSGIHVQLNEDQAMCASFITR